MNKQERKHYRETLATVPAELKTLPNWVCYRLENRAGQSKPTKVPYTPNTGDHAKANDLSTWTDYETCVAAVGRGEYDGIGFEFGSGYVGIDLDRCRELETGQVQDWAQDIIAHLDSYTEASPSGTGVHIIVKGALPPGRRREGPIEMYDVARFFTVTGAHVEGTPGLVEERSGELQELHEALFPPEPASQAIPGPRGSACHHARRARSPGSTLRCCPVRRCGSPCGCWACRSPCRTRWSPPSPRPCPQKISPVPAGAGRRRVRRDKPPWGNELRVLPPSFRPVSGWAYTRCPDGAPGPATAGTPARAAETAPPRPLQSRGWHAESRG